MSISSTAISVSLLHHHHVRIGRPFTFFSVNAPPSSYPTQLRCLATASGSNSGEREESRWLREEQRWLREEQRWLREESRWISERESLLREVSLLRIRLEQLESELERRETLTNSLSQIASLLQTSISLPSPQSDPLVLPPASTPSSASSPLPFEVTEQQEVKKDDDLIKQAKARIPRRRSLRVGSEGDEVKEMQEALLELGFYSGEEEMEFSSFSSGTQRAVKTWQATLGAPEDGVMTEELLERLYTSQQTDSSGSLGNANGTSVTSMPEKTEIQQTVVKKEEMSEIEASQRVFLLGENRWEEPSRLIKNEAGIADSSTKCLACRGEGRVLCTECDGTGEPNIEPQFLEWVGEELKCPYCEGQGYSKCDVCRKSSSLEMVGDKYNQKEADKKKFAKR